MPVRRAIWKPTPETPRRKMQQMWPGVRGGSPTLLPLGRRTSLLPRFLSSRHLRWRMRDTENPVSLTPAGISLSLQRPMASESFPVFQEREGEWTSPSMFLLEGIPILQLFTQDPAALHDLTVNFQTRADDVFVVSYPKSGMKRSISQYCYTCIQHWNGPR